MDQYTNKAKGLSHHRELALQNGDGIYITYADHLNSDAVTVMNVEGGKVVEEFELTPYDGSITWKFKQYLLKHITKHVYGFTAAWYTFPSAWCNNETYLKEYVYEHITLIVTPVE